LALVLAIEPDVRQAGILKHVVSDLVGAELVLVESREAAVASIDQRLPDVILVTALISPRDEDDLLNHLRTLEGSEHLQTHTIPLLSGARPDEGAPAKAGGLFGKFRRKKEEPAPIAGCAPELFAEEIRTFITRAAQMKTEAAAAVARAAEELEVDFEHSQARRRSGFEKPVRPVSAPVREEEPADASSSTWSDPFAWKSSYSQPATRSVSVEEAIDATDHAGPHETSVEPADDPFSHAEPSS
jgi:hypothetical protein